MDGFEETDKEKIADRYREIFSAGLAREKGAGMTLFGIHRDDLLIYLGGISARDFGSQGQQRSAVLALKTAEGIVSGEICGERPVYLFDDVLSELDEGRQTFILNYLDNWHVFITCCDPSTLLRSKKGKAFEVRDGSAQH